MRIYYILICAEKYSDYKKQIINKGNKGNKERNEYKKIKSEYVAKLLERARN